MRNSGGSPSLDNCIFRHNVARKKGAGMYNTSGAKPSLTSCVFRENAANSFSGQAGAMYNLLSDVTVIDCTFVANTASDVGALFNQGDSIFVDCRFLGNLGQTQAGAVLDLGSAAYINCEFSGNNTNGNGGAVNYAPLFGTNATAFINCSFSENVSIAGAGGALYANLFLALPNGPSMLNCILWGNAAVTGPEISMNGPVTLSVSYCDVEGGQAGVEVGGLATLDWGSGNIATDPFFVDATGPDDVAGSEDDDLHLMPSSPCINAGDPDFVADPVDEDIDGDPRIFNCRVD
ncbi:MAG: hypothetical protein O7F76_01050, partial [Planctomycetota bacterium]|nr:hypothetical protein [Planctomycetota bacterium]